jgi:Tfp pilus assembly protein PilX
MRRDDGGSILILAVIAMLILGVLGVSFALLARVETNIGVNYKQQAQAEALAEAGLDRARDMVRTAGGEGGTGFTKWFDGTNATHILVNGQTLGAGQYWARIDNDCPLAFTGTPAFPTYLRESAASCAAGTYNTVDTNEKAVVTAWGVAGTGRVRVRAMVYVDNPWNHVCADAAPDNGGYCNDTRNTKGNPAVIPADPNDANGPRAYSDLPRPIIGCSRIDPAVHRSAAYCAGVALPPKLYSQPAITGYPAYPPLGTAPQLVIMGEDPAIPSTSTAKWCGDDGPTNGNVKYFGYFDCALSTPCPEALCGKTGTVLNQRGCVRSGDPRLTAGPALAPPFPASPGSGPDFFKAAPCGADTGMVFKVAEGATLQFGNDIGSATTAYTVYAMHDAAVPTTTVPHVELKSMNLFGTLVVEGSANDKNKAIICTGGPPPSPIPATFNPPCPTGGTYGSAYGYPMALLTYDPKLAYPTVSPYAPQPITTDFATPNTVINGMIYSGGSVAFHPINVNGSTVAFGIDLQGASANYHYVPDYGNASPPAGFPPAASSSNPVVYLQKSFLMCDRYSATEATQATGCQ